MVKMGGSQKHDEHQNPFFRFFKRRSRRKHYEDHQYVYELVVKEKQQVVVRMVFFYAYHAPLVFGDMDDAEYQKGEREILPRNILVIYGDGEEQEYQYVKKNTRDILSFPFGYSISLKSEIGKQVGQNQPPEKKHYSLPSML